MFRPSPHRLAALGGCLIALAAPCAAEAATGAQIRASVTAGADWLDGQQQPAGNWTGFGANTVPSAMAAAGRNAADISQPGGTSAQDYLQTTLTGPTFTAPTSPSDTASRVGILQQAVLQGYSAGLTPARIAANQNLGAQLAGYYSGGYFAAQPQPGDPDARSTNFAVFGALALKRLGAPRFLQDRAVAAVRANQHTDGGWDFPYAATDADRSGPSSVDLTGAALAALCESGADQNDGDVRDGVDFLRSKLIASGGAAGSEGGFETGFGADADSTGWAVSGLNACGIDPQGPAFQGDGGLTPVDYLISLQETAGPTPARSTSTTATSSGWARTWAHPRTRCARWRARTSPPSRPHEPTRPTRAGAPSQPWPTAPASPWPWRWTTAPAASPSAV